MKKFLFCVFIVYFFFFNESTAQEHQLPEVPRISADLAYLKYKQGSVVIIDTMSRTTYAKYHIIGALNLYGDEGHLAMEWIRQAKLPIPLDKEIIVYCD